VVVTFEFTPDLVSQLQVSRPQVPRHQVSPESIGVPTGDRVPGGPECAPCAAGGDCLLRRLPGSGRVN